MGLVPLSQRPHKAIASTAGRHDAVTDPTGRPDGRWRRGGARAAAREGRKVRASRSPL